MKMNILLKYIKSPKIYFIATCMKKEQYIKCEYITKM